MSLLLEPDREIRFSREAPAFDDSRPQEIEEVNHQEAHDESLKILLKMYRLVTLGFLADVPPRKHKAEEGDRVNLNRSELREPHGDS